MSAPPSTAEDGAAAEWTEASERGARATEHAQQRIVDLPWGCWVEIDVSNPLGRLAIKPCCGERDPDDETGAYGCYLEPSLKADDGRPLAAMVRLLDRAQGVACVVPYAALQRCEYRDTRDLRTEGA